jgi:hypothetical protein
MFWSRRLTRSAAKLASVAAFTILAAALPAISLGGCSDSSGPQSGCGAVTVGGSLQVGVRACNIVDVNKSNITYTPDGGVSSFNFSVRCISTGKQYSGRVSNVQYLNGMMIGFDLQVDGEQCN